MGSQTNINHIQTSKGSNLMIQTIEEVKQIHKGYFFTPNNIKFCKSIISNNVYGGRYFITSERNLYTDPRLYTIRQVDEKGDISTVGGFQEHSNRARAMKRIQYLLEEGRKNDYCCR